MGPFKVTKMTSKLISFIDDTKVRQLNIITVLPIATETNEAYHKHYMCGAKVAGKEHTNQFAETSVYPSSAVMAERKTKSWSAVDSPVKYGGPRRVQSRLLFLY